MSKQISIFNELLRKFIHIASNTIIPILYIYLDFDVYIWMLLCGTSIFVIIDILRIRSSKVKMIYNNLFGFITRDIESDRLTGASWSLVSSCIISLIFSKDIAVPAILIGGYSDGAAAVVGRYAGNTYLYNDKTLEGSFAFIVSGILIVCIFVNNIALGVIALVVSMFVEILSLDHIDDNISVPLSYSLVYSIGLLIWIS